MNANPYSIIDFEKFKVLNVKIKTKKEKGCIYPVFYACFLTTRKPTIAIATMIATVAAAM